MSVGCGKANEKGLEGSWEYISRIQSSGKEMLLADDSSQKGTKSMTLHFSGNSGSSVTETQPTETNYQRTSGICRTTNRFTFTLPKPDQIELTQTTYSNSGSCGSSESSGDSGGSKQTLTYSISVDTLSIKTDSTTSNKYKRVK